MSDNIEGETTIKFDIKQGPRHHYYPMMIIDKGKGEVETCLSLNGFRFRKEAELLILKTREILSLVDEEDGSEI